MPTISEWTHNFCITLWCSSFDNFSIPGTFTVFAPTNQAFERLPSTTLSYLSSNTQALADVLKYHVVSGTVMKSDASNELQVPSLTGNKIRFNIYPFNSMVNRFLKSNFLKFLAQFPLYYIKSDWSYIFGLCV